MEEKRINGGYEIIESCWCYTKKMDSKKRKMV